MYFNYYFYTVLLICIDLSEIFHLASNQLYFIHQKNNAGLFCPIGIRKKMEN